MYGPIYWLYYCLIHAPFATEGLRWERRFRGLGSSLHSRPHLAVAARGCLVPLWLAKVDRGSVHARARRVAAALETRLRARGTQVRRLRRRESDKAVLCPRAPYPFVAGYTPFWVWYKEFVCRAFYNINKDSRRTPSLILTPILSPIQFAVKNVLYNQRHHFSLILSSSLSPLKIHFKTFHWEPVDFFPIEFEFVFWIWHKQRDSIVLVCFIPLKMLNLYG